MLETKDTGLTTCVEREEIERDTVSGVGSDSGGCGVVEERR